MAENHSAGASAQLDERPTPGNTLSEADLYIHASHAKEREEELAALAWAIETELASSHASAPAARRR